MQKEGIENKDKNIEKQKQEILKIRKIDESVYVENTTMKQTEDFFDRFCLVCKSNTITMLADYCNIYCRRQFVDILSSDSFFICYEIIVARKYFLHRDYDKIFGEID